MELPGWDDQVGLKTNLFWTEMILRERKQAAAAATFAAVLSLAASSTAKVEDKLEGINPFLDDYLSKTDHTAYTLDNKAEKLIEQLKAVLAKKAEFDQLRWLTSDEFSVSDWLKGK